MKIPSKLPITAEQSRAARFKLGLTQANVIEQSQLPGHKLKNFETGRFIPDMAFLENLRTFYEGSGIDFNDIETKQDTTETAKPGIGIVTQVQTCRFVVDQSLPQNQVDSILERMDSNDARITELMAMTLESGFLSTFSEKTDNDIKDLYGLMADNYLNFRTLQGRNILVSLPEKAELKTLADLVSSLNTSALLNDQPPAEEMEVTELAPLALSQCLQVVVARSAWPCWPLWSFWQWQLHKLPKSQLRLANLVKSSASTPIGIHHDQPPNTPAPLFSWPS